MSESKDWKSACGLLGDDYKVLSRYAEITQKGLTDEFIAVVALQFGHTWRTASERVKVLFKMGVIRKHGIYWIYENKNPTIAGLEVMAQLARDGINETLRETSSEILAKRVSDYAKSKIAKKDIAEAIK